eukprot:s10637_g2.t1
MHTERGQQRQKKREEAVARFLTQAGYQFEREARVDFCSARDAPCRGESRPVNTSLARLDFVLYRPWGVCVVDRGPQCTAVIDRAIQTLKKDLAGRAARDGGGWGDHVEQVTSAYNKRPHEAVHAAPEDVEKQPATTAEVQAQRRPDQEPATTAAGGMPYPCRVEAQNPRRDLPARLSCTFWLSGNCGTSTRDPLPRHEVPFHA